MNTKMKRFNFDKTPKMAQGFGVHVINTLDINTKPPNDSTAICNWEHDECAEYNTWHTGCDGMFQITEGMPSENDMKYCCYCGYKIEEHIISRADL